MRSLENFEGDALAGLADHLDGVLLGDLCLLVEDWLSLTTPTALFTVVSSLTLAEERVFALLVDAALVESVFLAANAKVLTFFWIVNHRQAKEVVCENYNHAFNIEQDNLMRQKAELKR